MRKGLVITLGVVALVLVVSPGFATAPIISCVPDIIVSDFEAAQTQDLDLFIFADALDLDTHVSDSDTTNPALLRWSFIQSTGPDIELNGIPENASGNVVAPGGADIRAISNMLSVRNVGWSPTADDPGPYPGPPAAGDQADSMIELFVSDGSNTDSQTVKITSIDEALAAGPFPWTVGNGDTLVAQPDSSYPFTSDQESWSQFFANNPGVIENATLAWAGGSLELTEIANPTSVEVVFGAWESPKDPAVAPSPRFGCILRARIQVRSDVDGVTCPGFRSRALTTRVLLDPDPTVGWRPDFMSRDFNSDLTVNYFTPIAGHEPGIAGRTYDILSWPQQIDSLMAPEVVTYFTVDLLDLDRRFSDDSGTLFVDQVDIDGVSRPADGTGRAEPTLSFNGNFLTEFTGGINAIAGGTLVPPTFNITANEIALTVQPGASFFDAAAVSFPVATDVGRYYRATFTVSSTATPGGDFGPTFRLGFGSSQFSFSVDKNLLGGGLLSAIGATREPFEVWMQAPPSAGAQTEPLFVRFQSWLGTSNTGFPHMADVSGTIRCHEVLTESFDSPGP